MRIIETRTAPNPRRVRIFLAEKGISLRFEELDLMQSELKTPEFAAQNPMQRVPVLVLDDGTCIAESVAICRYFEELQPEPALFGRAPLGRASVEMWNRRMVMGLFNAVTHAFRHLHPKMSHLEVPQVAEWGAANKAKALEWLAFLNDRLGESQFVAGTDYSIADITALVAVDFTKPARVDIPPGLDNLARWRAEVSARPSAAA